MHEAALKGHVDVVKVLLARQAKVDAANDSGATPLHDAATTGKLEIARMLIGKGAPVNLKDKETGATPLHQAASWGHLEVVELLLEKGAELNAANKEGLTAMGAAAANNHVAIVSYLKSRGAR